jgi:hypothetical protein
VKRVLTAFAVAATLGPASAAATPTSPVVASGAAPRGGDDLKLSYIVVLRNDKPKEIRKFKFRKLTADCDEGLLDLRGRFGRMNINKKRKFSGVVREKNGKVAVRGEVSRSGERANGSIRAQGDFKTDAGKFSNCDTGKVLWKGSTG